MEDGVGELWSRLGESSPRPTHHEVAQGSYMDRDTATFDTYADQWLEIQAASGDVGPVTLRGYKTGLQPAPKRFGDKRVPIITHAMLRRLMLDYKRRARATNQLTLYCIRSVMDLPAADGLIRVNTTREKLKVPGRAPKERPPLTPEDADLIAAEIVGDRLEVCWALTLAGLRRSEVMGLRWSDFTDTTVTVRRGRTDIDPTVTTPPKSVKGGRTLPLTGDLVAALKRTRALRKRELLALGGRWQQSAFVAVDAALEPLRPERYSDAWVELCKTAKVSKPVTLHGARHGSVSRMQNAGVPLVVVAAWHGHTIEVSTKDYSSVPLDDLERAGEALGSS